MTSEKAVFQTQQRRCAYELTVAMAVLGHSSCDTRLSKLQPVRILTQTKKDGCVIPPLDEDLITAKRESAFFNYVIDYTQWWGPFPRLTPQHKLDQTEKEEGREGGGEEGGGRVRRRRKKSQGVWEGWKN